MPVSHETNIEPSLNIKKIKSIVRELLTTELTFCKQSGQIIALFAECEKKGVNFTALAKMHDFPYSFTEIKNFYAAYKTFPFFSTEINKNSSENHIKQTIDKFVEDLDEEAFTEFLIKWNESFRSGYFHQRTQNFAIMGLIYDKLRTFIYEKAQIIEIKAKTPSQPNAKTETTKIPLSTFMNNIKGHESTLANCLIAPIQRLPRYPLLIKELKECVPTNRTAIHANLASIEEKTRLTSGKTPRTENMMKDAENAIKKANVVGFGITVDTIKHLMTQNLLQSTWMAEHKAPSPTISDEDEEIPPPPPEFSPEEEEERIALSSSPSTEDKTILIASTVPAATITPSESENSPLENNQDDEKLEMKEINLEEDNIEFLDNDIEMIDEPIDLDDEESNDSSDKKETASETNPSLPDDKPVITRHYLGKLFDRINIVNDYKKPDNTDIKPKRDSK